MVTAIGWYTFITSIVAGIPAYFHHRISQVEQDKPDYKTQVRILWAIHFSTLAITVLAWR